MDLEDSSPDSENLGETWSEIFRRINGAHWGWFVPHSFLYPGVFCICIYACFVANDKRIQILSLLFATTHLAMIPTDVASKYLFPMSMATLQGSAWGREAYTAAMGNVQPTQPGYGRVVLSLSALALPAVIAYLVYVRPENPVDRHSTSYGKGGLLCSCWAVQILTYGLIGKCAGKLPISIHRERIRRVRSLLEDSSRVINWDNLSNDVFTEDEKLQAMWHPFQAGAFVVSRLAWDAVASVSGMFGFLLTSRYAGVVSGVCAVWFFVSAISAAHYAYALAGITADAADFDRLARKFAICFDEQHPQTEELPQALAPTADKAAHGRFLHYIEVKQPMAYRLGGVLITKALVVRLFVQVAVGLPTLYSVLSQISGSTQEL